MIEKITLTSDSRIAEPDTKAQSVKCLTSLSIVEPKLFCMIETPQKSKHYATDLDNLFARGFFLSVLTDKVSKCRLYVIKISPNQ